MKPTQAQIQAGNYPKKHVRVGGLDISIENRKGSVRRGTDEDGKAWSVKMPCDYGYICGTLGKDGDHLDVFLGPLRNLTDESPVWVMNQKAKDGMAFDEHKVLLGFRHVGEAWQAYLRAYSIPMHGRLSGMTLGQLKEKLKAESGKLKKELGVDGSGGGMPVKEFYYEGDFRRQREIDRAGEERGKLIRTGILAASVVAGGAVAGKILKPVVAAEAQRGAVRKAVNKVVAAQRNTRVTRAAQSSAAVDASIQGDIARRVGAAEKVKTAKKAAAADKKARKSWYGSRKDQFTAAERAAARKFTGLARKDFQVIESEDAARQAQGVGSILGAAGLAGGFILGRRAGAKGAFSKFKGKYRQARRANFSKVKSAKAEAGRWKEDFRGASRAEASARADASNWRQRAERAEAGARSSGTNRTNSTPPPKNPYAGERAERWDRWQSAERMARESEHAGERAAARAAADKLKKRHNFERVLVELESYGKDLRDYGVAAGATAAGAGVAYAGWRAGKAAKAGEATAKAATAAADEARKGARAIRRTAAGVHARGKKIDRVLRGAKRQMTTFPTFSKWARAVKLETGNGKPERHFARAVKLVKNPIPRAKSEFLKFSPAEVLSMSVKDTGARDIPIRSIVSPQEHLVSKILKKYTKTPPADLPEVRKIGRQYQVIDGNHRIASRLISGDKKISARVLKFFAVPDEAGIPFTGKVAKDRYIKKIRDEDLDRRDANVLRAGAAGAVAGAVVPHRIRIGKRALIGAGLSAAGVVGVRAVTSRGRDPYGERSRGAKRAEGLPAAAATGAAAVLAARRLKIFSEKRRTPSWVKAGVSAAASGAALGLIPAFRRGTGLKTILKSVGAGAAAGGAIGGGGTAVGTQILGEPRPGEGVPITKRAAVGGAAVGAVGGLAAGLLARKTRAGARILVKASKAWRPAQWARGRGVLGVAGATGIGTVAGGAAGAFQGADEGQQVDTLNALKKRKTFSRRVLSVHLLGYYNQPREDWSYVKTDGSMGKGRFHARFANPVREAFGVGAPKLMPNPDGSPSVISQAQSLRGFYNEGKKVHKWGGRASRLVGDTGSVLAGQPRRRDASGRPVKREWEKSWFKNAVGSAATAGGLAGAALVATKTPFGRNTVQPALRRVLKKAEDKGFKIFSARLLSAKFFDEWANIQGWDVRDPRGKSARVFAPGSRRRVRRPAEWHEKKDGQRKILAGLAVAGTVAGLGAGFALRGTKAGASVARAVEGTKLKVVPMPEPTVQYRRKRGGGFKTVNPN
jgi:hypothetical protein